MDEERGTQREIARSYGDRVQSRFTRTVWRSERFLLTVVLFAGGVIAIYYCERERPQEFFNTGPLSRSHAHLKNGCISCHVPESLTIGSVEQSPGFFKVLNDRFEKGAPSLDRIDRACGQCHKQHDFHEPNVITDRSCSACHKEHQGLNGLMAVANMDCASCHNNTEIMQASAERGKQLPPTRFHLNPRLVNFRQIVLERKRPANGYTKTFASFSEGHPPFQLQRENVRDNDVLRFNHARHLNSSDIPPTKTGKLD